MQISKYILLPILTLSLIGCATTTGSKKVSSSHSSRSTRSTSHSSSAATSTSKSQKTQEDEEILYSADEPLPTKPTPMPQAAKPSSTVVSSKSSSIAKTTTKSTASKTVKTTKTSSKKSSGSYIVKSGDSLWKIAHKNHTTVKKLKAANNLSSDALKPGMSLKIP
jgi:LysM repeat protein